MQEIFEWRTQLILRLTASRQLGFRGGTEIAHKFVHSHWLNHAPLLNTNLV